MATLQHSLVAPIQADHQQFSFRFEHTENDDVSALAEASRSHIVQWIDREWLSFTVFQWFGRDLPIEIHSARPAELDPEWTDVAEVSVIARGIVLAQSFAAPAGDGTLVPIDTGVPYRLRYAVAGVGSSAKPDDVRYLVQLWPEPASRGEAVRYETRWGLYWLINRVATYRRAHTPELPTPAARVETFLDDLERHIPDVFRREREHGESAVSVLVKAYRTSWLARGADSHPAPDELERAVRSRLGLNT